MKKSMGILAVIMLGAFSPLSKLYSQTLSPTNGIDDVEVATINAVVDSVDLEKRKVTLTLDDGKKKTYKADKMAENLEQLQPGDHLKITCTEELMVTVNKAGESPSAAEVGAVNLAPPGSNPGGILVDTVAISGKILATDPQKHKVTFEDPDGKKKTVKVRKTVDISKLEAGESVDAVMTESVIIQVQK